MRMRGKITVICGDPSWKGAELRLGGTLSDRARREVETLGWSVVTKTLSAADRNNE